MKAHGAWCLVLAAAALSGCDRLGSGGPAPAGSAAPTPTTARPAGTGGDSYPLSAIRTVADDCRTAAVVLASAPKSVGADYGWPWTRQAMYANKQFQVVAGPPASRMQVAFKVLETDTGFSLVASCADGFTCNRLAAMYKHVVKSSSPQVVCGPLPIRGAERPEFLRPKDDHWPPASATEIVPACARIAACLIATDASTPGDPGIECQKAPTKFKLACATRDPCAEVLACLGR